jgi:hypothetical protein
LVEHVLERTGIVLAERAKLDGDLRRRHGLMLPCQILLRRCRKKRDASSRKSR